MENLDAEAFKFGGEGRNRAGIRRLINCNSLSYRAKNSLILLGFKPLLRSLAFCSPTAR